MPPCRAHLRDQRRDHRRRRATVDSRERRRRSAKAVAEHLGVANAPELGPDPAQLVTKRVDPVAVEERLERAQVAAQAARCYTSLVNVLDVDPEANAGVVAEQPDHRRAQRPAHDVTGSGRRVEGDGREFGRRCSDQPEGSCDECARRRGLRPRSLAACREDLEQDVALADRSISRKRCVILGPE